VTPALVLVGHGSRDPRAAAALAALADRVRSARTDLDVRLCFLELSVPSLEQVLSGLTGRVVVVPLLLGEAHHARVDIPARVRAAAVTNPSAEVVVTPPLGNDVLLLDALADRARSGLASGIASGVAAGGVDGWVLAATGSTRNTANEAVDEVAAVLAARLGVPVRAAFVTAAPDIAASAAALREQGCTAPGLLSWFLAPGRLLDRAVAAAGRAELRPVAEPLGDHPATCGAVLRTAAAYLEVPEKSGVLPSLLRL
jgi:sirohydrochlorin ferrochelatase